MRIGIDIHGVIDTYPELFSELTKKWSSDGHKIYIMTGQEQSIAEKEVVSHDIHFDYFYSIVDYHKSKGTTLYTRSDKDGYWMDKDIWNSSKGEYAYRNIINIHFDDQIEYARYFPYYCTFFMVPEVGFENIVEQILK